MPEFYCKHHQGYGIKAKNRDMCVDCRRAKQREWNRNHQEKIKPNVSERVAPITDPDIGRFLSQKW